MMMFSTLYNKFKSLSGKSDINYTSPVYVREFTSHPLYWGENAGYIFSGKVEIDWKHKSGITAITDYS